MQDKITDARNYVIHTLKEEGRTRTEAIYLFQLWIQKNKSNIRLVGEEIEPTPEEEEDDFPPAC